MAAVQRPLPPRHGVRPHLAPSDSLHIVISGDHISAHVDRVSPLAGRQDEPSRYSLRQAAVHNVVGAAQDVVRLLRGRQGDHRSHLDCEWQWHGHDHTPDPAHLLDPTAWSVHLEARVEGSLDEARLGKALDAVLGHRPVEHDPLDWWTAPTARRSTGLARNCCRRRWP